jgi:hypothetical protein
MRCVWLTTTGDAPDRLPPCKGEEEVLVRGLSRHSGCHWGAFVYLGVLLSCYASVMQIGTRDEPVRTIRREPRPSDSAAKAEGTRTRSVPSALLFVYACGARLQMPITWNRLPPAKLMLAESLHFALVAVGAVESSVRVVTPVLSPFAGHAAPFEWR